jgi:hypothetical protein
MSHFDAAIGDVAGTLATLEQQLEHAQAEWISQIKKFLPDWFRSQARDTVVDSPDAAASLGQERLSALKREVEELATATPALVDELVGVGTWPHTLRDDGGEPLSPSVIWPARRGSFQPEEGLRKLLWKLYVIFAKYGIGDKGIMSAGMAKNQYPYALPDQGVTGAISARYVDLLGKRYEQSARLRQLKLDRMKSDVAKQWDEA